MSKGRNFIFLGILYLFSSILFAEEVTTPTTSAAELGNTRVKKHDIISDSFNRKKIIKTKYFKFYYDASDGSINSVLELIKKADHIAEVEAKLFKMKLPKLKMRVFVVDAADTTNAQADGNMIYIFTSNTGQITNKYKDQTTMLFSHELTHQLLNFKLRSNGIARYIPFSFGWVFRSSIPSWWTEGSAVLMESMITQGGGRTFDPDFTSRAKRDINEDDFKGLGGPGLGNHPYDYGNAFYRFYLETFGIERISDAIDYYASHKIRGIGYAYSHVVGLSSDELYHKWLAFEKELVTKSIKGPIVNGSPIHDNHVWTQNMLKDGNSIWAYIVEEDDSRTFKSRKVETSSLLYHYPIKSDGTPNYEAVQTYTVPDRMNTSQFAIKGKELYYINYYRSSVIKGAWPVQAYRINIETDKKIWLKKIKRPNGFVNANNKIYYTYLDKRSTGLSTLDGQVIIEPGKYIIEKMFDAGDDKILLVGGELGKYGSRIFLVDAITKKVQFLTMGESASLDGDNLYFANHFGSNVNNIYRMNMKTKEVSRVTNVLYKAEAPFIIHNKLVFLNYSTRGYQVNILDPKKGEKIINETKPLSALEQEQFSRKEKHANLYGQYSKLLKEEYKPEKVVTYEDLVNNKKKQVGGYLLPDLLQGAWIAGFNQNNSYLNYSSPSKRDTFLMLYGFDSQYGLVKKYHYPVREDIDGRKVNQWPTFYTVSLKGMNNDRYLFQWEHSFSRYSGLKFGIKHWESILHGHSPSEHVQGRLTRNHSSQFYVQIPFDSYTLDKHFWVNGYFNGALYDTKLKGFKKLYGNGIVLEGGTNDNFIGLQIRGIDKVHTVWTQNFMYIDSKVKDYIPYLKDVDALSLRTRFYFAPKAFNTSITSPSVGVNGLGYNNFGMINGTVSSYVVNTKFAGMLYGDLKHRVNIDLGTKFGRFYLSNMELKLGFSYIGYMDEDYYEAKPRLEMMKKISPRLAGMSIKDLANLREQQQNNLIANPHVDQFVNNLHARGLFTRYNNRAIKEVLAGKRRFLNPSEQSALLRETLKSNDPLFKKAYNDLQHNSQTIARVINIKLTKPVVKKKYRQGFSLNPSVTFNGTIFNGIGVSVSLGDIYLADATDFKLRDQNVSYLGFTFFF